MRILLTGINAKYIHSNLAIYSLKAAAGPYASQVELAEFTINHRVEEILREIYSRQPEVLLFSCYIWNIEYVKELTAECRKVLPQVPIWLGGPEVSYCAEEALQEHRELTGILTGEGEESFRKLIECYVNQKDLSAVPGAVFWETDQEGKALRIRKIPARQPLDMDLIPFPYGDLKDMEHRIIYYESSRGCPFSCSYCLSSIEKKVRLRSLNLVKEELSFFLKERVSQVKFVDRTFNCSRSHSLAIWRYLLENDNGVTNFHFEIAADLLGEEELELMEKMRPGLIQLEIGVQSTNPRTLQAICRTTAMERLRENVGRIHAMGNIHQHLDLIAGLPYEGYESFRRSFDQVFAMKPEQLQLGFLKVLRGSLMHREAERYGIVYRDKPPYEVLYSRWLSFGEILQLKAIEEMVEIYYNSLQFRKTLEKLIPYFSSPFDFFEELAKFYEEEELKGRSHSRLQRYEILLAFIRRRLPEKERYFRELLTMDLYLREKVKSRPDFAADLSPYREKIREIQKKVGKEKHVELRLETGEEPAWLIFDYSRRNPLTGDAFVSLWEDGGEHREDRG